MFWQQYSLLLSDIEVSFSYGRGSAFNLRHQPTVEWHFHSFSLCFKATHRALGNGIQYWIHRQSIPKFYPNTFMGISFSKFSKSIFSLIKLEFTVSLDPPSVRTCLEIYCRFCFHNFYWQMVWSVVLWCFWMMHLFIYFFC